MGLWKAATAKHNLILLFMVVLPLAGLLGSVMWILHTPTPSVKAPAVIDRNSLLPHRYAGPCMNCHQIAQVGPVAMNRGNIGAFKLTNDQQQLLLAGQRVEILGLSQKLSIPAITRSDILPHPFVGVCSNCHLVLDIRPSSAYMRTATRRAGQHLLERDLGVAAIARGGVATDLRRERYRRLWGYAALPLFLLTAVYVILRLIVRSNPTAYQNSFPLARWLVVHQWSAVGFSVAAIMHWYYSNRGNNFLHLAFAAVITLTLAGCVLRYRLVKDGPGRSLLLLHTQRFIFLALIALLAMGHFVAEFH